MALLFVLGSTGTVQAGNEDELPVGNRAAMVGGAVVATVHDGSATYFNPAGLGAIQRSSVDVSASAYSLRYYRVPGFLRSASGVEEDASVFEFVAVPTQIAYVRRLASGVSLGLGYFVPRASDVVLRERIVAPDGQDVSTWSLDLRLNSTTYVLGAAVGVRVGPRLRLGGGLFAVYDDRVESSAVFGSVMRAGVATRSVQLSALGTSSRLAGEAGVGVQWDPAEHWTVAANLRGPRVQLIRTGTESLNASQAFPDEMGALGLSAFSTDVPDEAAQLGALGLGRYHLAAAYTHDVVSVSAEFDVQPGLRSARTGTARRFTWNARAGGTYRAGEGLLFGAGVFTDRDTAIDEGLGAASSTTDFYGATLGLELDHQLALKDEPDADSLVLTTVFALRYAYGLGTSSVLVIDPQSDFSQLFGDDAADAVTHEFGLHVGSALYF